MCQACYAYVLPRLLSGLFTSPPPSRGCNESRVRHLAVGPPSPPRCIAAMAPSDALPQAATAYSRQRAKASAAWLTAVRICMDHTRVPCCVMPPPPRACSRSNSSTCHSSCQCSVYGTWRLPWLPAWERRSRCFAAAAAATQNPGTPLCPWRPAANDRHTRTDVERQHRPRQQMTHERPQAPAAPPAVSDARSSVLSSAGNACNSAFLSPADDARAAPFSAQQMTHEHVGASVTVITCASPSSICFCSRSLIRVMVGRSSCSATRQWQHNPKERHQGTRMSVGTGGGAPGSTGAPRWYDDVACKLLGRAAAARGGPASPRAILPKPPVQHHAPSL